MRITKVHVKGFKSLVDFELELAPFTCLVGMNGCGKSTVLQFFDFLSSLLSKDINGWFLERDWQAFEVATFWSEQSIQFCVDFSNGSIWEGEYSVPKKRCTREDITTPSSHLVFENDSVRGFANGDEFHGHEGGNIDIATGSLEFRGSVATLIRDEALPKSVRDLRDFLRGSHTFEALSPHSLRRLGRGAPVSIGRSGENLTAFFDSLDAEVRDEILKDLVELYPQLQFIHTLEHPGGQKELATVERYVLEEPNALQEILVRSGHINDGFLRTFAMLVELRSDHQLLLFDEIENGINPESVDYLVSRLTSSAHQIVTTTHSPLILNYLPDDIARESVVFLYKGRDGATRAKRFFDIPSIREKLDVMGPGEAFVDTNLVALTEELNAAVAGA